MEIYNDEILTPETYELMAKEYSKNLNKKIKIIDVTVDKNAQNKIENNIKKYLDNIVGCTNYLSKLNLNKNYKSKLKDIKEILKTFDFKQDSKDFTTAKYNYCFCLNLIIQNCCNAVCDIQELSEFCEHNYNLKSFVDIIKITTEMFGECKYRTTLK